MKRYQAQYAGDDTWSVIDVRDMEICLCNPYDGQAETPEVRAKAIAAALNAAEAGR